MFKYFDVARTHIGIGGMSLLSMMIQWPILDYPIGLTTWFSSRIRLRGVGIVVCRFHPGFLMFTVVGASWDSEPAAEYPGRVVEADLGRH